MKKIIYITTCKKLNSILKICNSKLNRWQLNFNNKERQTKCNLLKNKIKLIVKRNTKFMMSNS